MRHKPTISDEELRDELKRSYDERARLLLELARVRNDSLELNEKIDREILKRNTRFQRAMSLWRLLDELLAIAGPQPLGTALPPPENSELRGFGGVKIAFPHTEMVVDTLAEGLRRDSAFPTKHKQLLALAVTGRGGTMIDVGANIGLTAIPPLLLDLVDSVIAVEPASLVLPFLEWNLAANGLSHRVKIVPAALGDVEGTIELTLSGAMGLHRIKGSDGADAIASEAVREITLDGLVHSLGLSEAPPRFVKIDTQGAEGRILRGARDLLARRASLFEIEFWPHGIEALGDDPREVLDAVEAHFSWFMDEKSPAGTLAAIAGLREAVASLEPGRHTDLLLLP